MDNKTSNGNSVNIDPVTQNTHASLSFMGIFLFSILFGPISGFLLSWKNYEQTGQRAKANSFFRKGIIVVVGLYVCFKVMSLLAVNSIVQDIVAYGSLGIFPFLVSKDLLKLDSSKTKFMTWSMFKWALIGLVINITLALVI